MVLTVSVHGCINGGFNSWEMVAGVPGVRVLHDPEVFIETGKEGPHSFLCLFPEII